MGVYRKEKEDYIVTELPPGTWTQDYREFLEKELSESRIKDFVDVSTDTEVNIRIKGMDEKALVKSLTDKVKLTNMHAFNAKGQITKYDSLNAILKEYAEVRLALYESRRVKQIADLQGELPYHANVVHFIEDQISASPKVDLRRKTEEQCTQILAGNGFSMIGDSYDYLLRLPVRSFTAEQVEKHRKKLADIRAEIARLESTKAADLWLTELSGV
jgi:DNA topoisomerase-2